MCISTLLLAWQTRAVAEQARVSNAIAGTSVLHNSLEGIRAVFMLFVERPELRAYFYDGKPCPKRGATRARVLTIADMFADALEDGLVGTRLVPSSESTDDWIGYSQHVIRHSPALREILTTFPRWWPNLYNLLQGSR